ncbi:MAG: SDR family oxidoreductase [Actinomycetota bacterium]|nr:SDR family oxidoreductase [Actinomycetota bacterium]
MPEQHTSNLAAQLRRRPPFGSRQTVLVTGGSGVVGQGLLPRLAGMDVICLVHRTPIGRPGVVSVAGDLMQPRFGLSESDYDALARRVDAVVHCAAVTEFNRTDGSLEATNIGGTEQVLAFVAAAGARLYHVSTAFLHAQATGGRGETAVRYAASKRAGEALVKASGLPHVILRPSVVVGDSATGEVSAFQGLYLVAGAILSALVPLIPFDPAWPIDFIPNDVVADAIAVAVERELTSGELWLTAGDRALSFDQAVQEVVTFGREIGLPVDPPRFVPPDVFDRLIGPVFLEFLPRTVRYTVSRLLEFFTIYLAMDGAMPNSLNELAALGAKPLPDSSQTLRSSLRYWAEATGRLSEPDQSEVA